MLIFCWFQQKRKKKEYNYKHSFVNALGPYHKSTKFRGTRAKPLPMGFEPLLPKKIADWPQWLNVQLGMKQFVCTKCQAQVINELAFAMWNK